MTAKIICVCNQKGGCGKTTVTMALAGALAARGLKILVVDGDPQGSASSWSANAPEDAPFPATVVNLSKAGKSLPLEVRKMVANYDVVLIDCPPAVDSPVPQAALLVSDLAVIPLIPSPIDVAAAAPFIRLVEQVQSINVSLRGLVVPSMVQKSTKLARAYLESFPSFALPVSEVQLVLRDPHRQACALGAYVGALGDQKATAEVEELCSEVEAALHGAPSLEAVV